MSQIISSGAEPTRILPPRPTPEMPEQGSPGPDLVPPLLPEPEIAPLPEPKPETEVPVTVPRPNPDQTVPTTR